MSRHDLIIRFTTSTTLLFSAICSTALAQPNVPTPAGPQLNSVNEAVAPEVLEQGPLHEAFARPLTLDDQAIIIDRQPPEPINELPPEERVEGTNVNWLPGYWHFDVERNDFVWVSGLWRDFPPKRTWVPGEWQQVETGYQWIAGFWADARIEQQKFLPIPPATIEQGPSSPAPGNNYLWAPGCWQWRAGIYVWQPGFWYAAQPDWVWVPNHYCYTPHGSVYVSGYWDYPLTRRGLVYSPVYWGAGYHAGPTFAYRPTSFVTTGLLVANLLLDHHHGRYFYGSRWAHGHKVPNWLSPWNRKSYSKWGHSHGKARLHDPLWAHVNWNGHRKGSHGKHGFADHKHKNKLGNSHGKNKFNKQKLGRTDQLVRNVNKLKTAERKQLKLHHNNATEQAGYKKKADKYRDFHRNSFAKTARGKKGPAFNKSMRIPHFDKNNKTVDARKRHVEHSAKGRSAINRHPVDTVKSSSPKPKNTTRLRSQQQKLADQVLRSQKGPLTKKDQTLSNRSGDRNQWKRNSAPTHQRTNNLTNNGNRNANNFQRRMTQANASQGSSLLRQQRIESMRRQIINNQAPQTSQKQRSFDIHRYQQQRMTGRRNGSNVAAQLSINSNRGNSVQSLLNRRVSKPQTSKPMPRPMATPQANRRSGRNSNGSPTVRRNSGQSVQRKQSVQPPTRRSRGNQGQTQLRTNNSGGSSSAKMRTGGPRNFKGRAGNFKGKGR